MVNSPLVSVVMPVHNAATAVADAIESILKQTFNDFEFIVVDDGSTDGSGKILREYEERDKRIKLYCQAQAGLIATLNRYCRLAAGKYIARMDADDISSPTRLEKQCHFLETHPEIGVIGTWIQDINYQGVPGIAWPVPADPAIVRWFLLFGNCMAHSSVMMRRDLLERLGYYRSDALHIEDYDLWIRAVEVTGLANIPEVLVQYRISSGSISGRNSLVQEKKALDLKCSLISSVVCRAVDRETIEALQQSGEGSPVTNIAAAIAAANLIPELYLAYVAKIQPDRQERSEIAMDAIRRLWLLAVFSKTMRIGFRSLRFVPALLSLRGIKMACSLGMWVLKYRGRVFIRQRR